jgi:hypothetical protein
MTEAGELTGTHEGVVVWCMAARGLRSAEQAQRSHLRTAGSGAEGLPPRIPTWDGINPHLSHQEMAFGLRDTTQPAVHLSGLHCRPPCRRFSGSAA